MSFPQFICKAKTLSHFFTEMKIYTFASQMTLRSIVIFAKINSQKKINLYSII